MHATGLAPTHAPATHVSLCVHELLSLHAVPFGAGGVEQTPDVGSQVPARWHASLAAQATGFPPAHTPPVHTSVCVQAFPSLQVVPFAAAGFEQRPVDGLHKPTPWHASLAVQTMGFVPRHVPDWHAPLPKQRLPCEHEVPFGSGVCEHAPSALQVSTLHGLPVLHEDVVHVGASTPTSTVTSLETSTATSAAASWPASTLVSTETSMEASAAAS
jgi:hypothetical protein